MKPTQPTNNAALLEVGGWPTANSPAEANMLAMLKRIGVLPHEVARHVGGEILLNEAAVRKLAAHAPDQALAAEFLKFLDGAIREMKASR